MNYYAHRRALKTVARFLDHPGSELWLWRRFVGYKALRAARSVLSA